MNNLKKLNWKKWGQTPIFQIEEKMGSDPDIPNRDKNCGKNGVRPRYSLEVICGKKLLIALPNLTQQLIQNLI